jgi:hypothetical protein
LPGLVGLRAMALSWVNGCVVRLAIKDHFWPSQYLIRSYLSCPESLPSKLGGVGVLVSAAGGEHAAMAICMN